MLSDSPGIVDPIRIQVGGWHIKLDKGVPRALLEIPQYKAGARSLVFLCQQLQQTQNGIPSRSGLPGLPLFDMHVDVKKFWGALRARPLVPSHELYWLGAP